MFIFKRKLNNNQNTIVYNHNIKNYMVRDVSVHPPTEQWPKRVKLHRTWLGLLFNNFRPPLLQIEFKDNIYISLNLPKSWGIRDIEQFQLKILDNYMSLPLQANFTEKKTT